LKVSNAQGDLSTLDTLIGAALTAQADMVHTITAPRRWPSSLLAVGGVAFFGSPHGQGRDAVGFHTEKKVVVKRWPKVRSRKF
jgi:hypothetical protein